MQVIRFIILLSCFAISFMNYGQNSSFFVKTTGDTIQCEITRVSEDYLFYSVDNMRSRIEMEDVKFHTGILQNEMIENSKDSIVTDEVVEVVIPIDIEPEKFKNPQRVRIAANIAGGYRVAQAGDLPRSYINKLRKGIQYSVKGQFFGRNDIGFGIEFHQFFNKVEDNLPMIGDVSDDITISYLGVSTIQRRSESEDGNRSYFEVGLGIVFYENKGALNRQPVMIEGSTFGFNIAYGYDVFVSKNISVGLELGVLLARLNTFKVNGQIISAQNPEDGESLTRINFGMGIRFSK